MSDDRLLPSRGSHAAGKRQGQPKSENGLGLERNSSRWNHRNGEPREQTQSASGAGEPARTASAPAAQAGRKSSSGQPGKFAELDGLRGVAALVVVLWHFAFAFLPDRIGIVPDFDPARGLVGSPAFALIDGPGAVMLFFVLSG